MTPLKVAGAFVAASNAGDVNRLAGLMTPEHMFVDTNGSDYVGRDQMKSNWQKYFDMVPDFQIEVSERFEDKGTVILLGRAGGTFVQNGELKRDNHWSFPAAWRGIVDSNFVAIWQLFANQHVMHEILKRIRAT